MLLCLGALLALFLTPLSLAARLALSVSLCNFAPVASVLYRGWQRRRFYAPLQAIVLYHVYFLGRFYALYKLVFFRSFPFGALRLKPKS